MQNKILKRNNRTYLTVKQDVTYIFIKNKKRNTTLYLANTQNYLSLHRFSREKLTKEGWVSG